MEEEFLDFNYVEYLIKENDKIVKYGITYDEKVLEKLRKDICINCGVRRHQIYNEIGTKVYKEDFLIENFNSKFISTKEADSGYYDNYLLDYYLIDEPYLSKIIKEFINGKIINLVCLLHYNKIEDNKYNFDLEIHKLRNMIKNCTKDEFVTTRTKSIVKKINDNLEEKKYNKKLNLVDQKDYICKLKSLIILNKKDEMSYEEYRKFISFTKKLQILEIKK